MNTLRRTLLENLGGKAGHKLAHPSEAFNLETDIPSLTGKTAIVTGGSEGIGLACTHTLLAHDIATIHVLSLEPSREDAARRFLADSLGSSAAARVHWHTCDLSNWPQTARVGAQLSTELGRLDILLNVAGRGIMSFATCRQGYDANMSTNHLGHAILTTQLLPRLRATAAAAAAQKDVPSANEHVRIVHMSSNVHASAPSSTAFSSPAELRAGLSSPLSPQELYGRSKLANLLYARYLARRLTGEAPSHPTTTAAILSNAAHPGIVATRQSEEHIHDAHPLAGYGMSVAMQPFKKDIWEACCSPLFAATRIEESGRYVCPPAVVEEGSELSRDVALGDRLMRTTREVLAEWLEREGEEAGAGLDVDDV